MYISISSLLTNCVFATEFFEALSSPSHTTTTTTTNPPLPNNDISSSTGLRYPTTLHQTTNTSPLIVGSSPILSTPLVSQPTEGMYFRCSMD